MSLRIAAIAMLTGACVLILTYLHFVGEGWFATPAAHHLRVMKERTAVPAAVVPCRFADFAALPLGGPLASYAPLERRAVSLEGHVAGMIRSSDGDLHLEIAAIPRTPGDRETLYVTGEVTSAFQRGGWTLEGLRQAFLPVRGGPRFDRATPRVRISGWLLYDWQYDGLPDRDPVREAWNRINPVRKPSSARRTAERRRAGQSIWPRLTGWEIHPVTAIEIWDDTSGRFRRLPS